jgi:hypothetical protein
MSMQLQISMLRTSQGVATRIAGVALAIALLAGAAAPARADGDFENAFERQLGSILAFEAVAVSKAVLFPGAVAYPAPAYYPVPVAQPVPVPVAVPVAVPYYAVPVARPVVYYGGGQYYGKHRGHGRHGWHRGHHDCD